MSRTSPIKGWFLFFICASSVATASAVKYIAYKAEEDKLMAIIDYSISKNFEQVSLEMRKILHRRIRHSKVLPTQWLTGAYSAYDLAGNMFIIPQLIVDLEDGGYEFISFHGDELRLSTEEGDEGSWAVDEEGNIHW